MSDRTIKFDKNSGLHIHNVPARDLTVDEYQQHKTLIEQQEAILGRKLYEPGAATKPAKSADKAGDN